MDILSPSARHLMAAILWYRCAIQGGVLGVVRWPHSAKPKDLCSQYELFDGKLSRQRGQWRHPAALVGMMSHGVRRPMAAIL